MYDNIKYNKEFAKEFTKESYKKDRDKHIINNIPLAVNIANRFKVYDNPYYDKEDLIQYSVLGLIKSIDKFDFDSGYQLATYATVCCQGEILRFIRDSNSVKVPRSILDLNTKLNRYIREGYSDEEIKKMMGVDYEDLLIARSAMSSLSLDNPIRVEHSGDGLSLYEIISNGESLEDEVCLSESLKSAFKVLTEKERRVIELTYFENKTQREIGFILGTTQVQVSRILKKSLLKLRKEMKD